MKARWQKRPGATRRARNGPTRRTWRISPTGWATTSSRRFYDLKDPLTQEIKDWQEAAERDRPARALLEYLQALWTHAADLPVAARVRAEVEAIEQNRSLLTDPDPVPGLLERLTEALREAINEVHGACSHAA